MTDTIVAFLDVLGCSATAVNGTDTERSRLLAFLKRINESYLSNQGVVVRDLGGGHQIIHNPEVFACSDSVLLSVKIGNPSAFDESRIITNLLSVMISIYWQGIHAGYLIRGGVARGECIHQANQIFGKAYVKAVGLEKETQFPRIQFDADVFDRCAPTILDDQTRSICVDERDGKFFLNCLGWHSGVWMDYMHFKYGTSEWPRDYKAEVLRAIGDIETTMSTQIAKLDGSPRQKWEWFREHWEEKKKTWPIFAEQGAGDG